MILLWLYLPYILAVGWYETAMAEIEAEPEADSKILKFPERLSK